VESELERNAEEWFRYMVDTNLAPGLRALGFFGVGRQFRIETNRHWGEVVVEQARSFTERAVRFTVHVGVMDGLRLYSLEAPAARAQELAAFFRAGPIRFTGSHAGRGYLEMTGY